MHSSQKNDLLLDFAHLVSLALHGPMRSEEEDCIQGDYANRHVRPAPPVHVFVI